MCRQRRSRPILGITMTPMSCRHQRGKASGAVGEAASLRNITHVWLWHCTLHNRGAPHRDAGEGFPSGRSKKMRRRRSRRRRVFPGRRRGRGRTGVSPPPATNSARSRANQPTRIEARRERHDPFEADPPVARRMPRMPL